MSRNDLNDLTLSRLSKAADWLQRLYQSPDDDLLLEKCQRWLDAALENAKAFESMEMLWQAMGQLATKSTPQMSQSARAAARTMDLDSQCGGRQMRATKQGVQSAARHCVAATMAPVKQQLPHAPRLSRPPAQA
jgi:ferric-dicitrate binding protein FerR (iron transport regulator)